VDTLQYFCDTLRTMPTPLEILQHTYGYPNFRGLQEEVITHVVGGGNAFVLMPTGGGKSVCYQIPALCREGVGIVVSPLIALMQDQVTALRQLGIKAAALKRAPSRRRCAPVRSIWFTSRRSAC
jgi:ATP-dependent DNA helicase RecQ